MSDWTAEAEPAISLCLNWANSVHHTLQVHLYLFGSAIYRGGEQFDSLTSDIDIIAVLPEGLDAAARAEAIEELRKHKVRLELELIPTLGRPNSGEPGVSLVPITSTELRTNVHKSGARRFFDKNFFLDLNNNVERLGLPDAGLATLRDENRTALEYIQKIRNQYLGQAANLAGGLDPYSGADPMPKALLRSAALLDPAAADGEWYDTRRGLELLFDLLRSRRTDGAFRPLFDKVSIRRGGRGAPQPLSSMDQLLLSELLYDVAANVQTEDLIQWEITVEGDNFTTENANPLIRKIQILAPDATLISIRFGSIILRFQSPESRFYMLMMFLEKDILASFLEIEKIRLTLVDAHSRAEATDAFAPRDREQQLQDVISLWKPEAFQWEVDAQRQLINWLQTAVETQLIPNARIVSEPAVGLADRVVRPDVLVMWDRQPTMVGIELLTLSKPAHFFAQLERSLEMPFPVILVAVGTEYSFSRVSDDVERLGKLGGNVRVVFIPYNDRK